MFLEVKKPPEFNLKFLYIMPKNAKKSDNIRINPNLKDVETLPAGDTHPAGDTLQTGAEVEAPITSFAELSKRLQGTEEGAYVSLNELKDGRKGEKILYNMQFKSSQDAIKYLKPLAEKLGISLSSAGTLRDNVLNLSIAMAMNQKGCFRYSLRVRKHYFPRLHGHHFQLQNLDDEALLNESKAFTEDIETKLSMPS